MSRNTFLFKQFSVEQEGVAMKVGTDAVLLGAWCRVLHSDKAILDIGTGTGVIALQLAQRTVNEMAGVQDAIVEAVEVDEPSALRAESNFATSPWANRLMLHKMPVQELAATMAKQGCARFDHIVSNPPYFTDSLASPNLARNISRHTDLLSYEELMSVCDSMLYPTGRISLVLPAGAESKKMTELASTHGFVISRLTEVHSTLKSGPKRILVEFSRVGVVPEISSLVIEDAGPGSFSAEYRALTRDFYLHF